MRSDEVCMKKPMVIEEIVYNEVGPVCVHEEYESCFMTYKSVMRKSMVRTCS